MLRSAQEQRNIIYSFVSYLKISPIKLQIKVLTRRAEINRHLDTVRKEMEQETNEQCLLMQEDYLQFVQQIGSREAITRRFFLIFEYEPWSNTKRSDEEGEAINALQSAVHTATNYLRQCGNEVIVPENWDEFTIDVLYNLLCRNESAVKPLSVRAQEVVAEYLAKGRDSEIDHIPATEFCAPKSIDFTHGHHICIDGLYYAYLLVPSDGYKTQVPAGWLSLIVNAGDGIDMDMFLSRQPKETIIQKVGQQLRINRSKIKDASDTNTDFDDIDGAIRSGYFLKEGLANNEDFYYSLFKQASDTVRSGVIIGLGSRLQVFQSELIKKNTAKNEIDLELPGQQPCAYFLVTSDQDSTFDFLASLFLSFCFIKLVRYADHNCEGGKLPVPVHILGEELTACGTIPDLSRRLSVIRSRNISMSCVFQNLAGLQNRYPQNLWQEIIGNCDAQLFLGCTDQLTAEFISARTGLASVAVSSKSKQLGTWRISNYTPEFRETSGVGKRPVLTPDEVLRLPLDQALIIIRGKKVLQVDKMDYSKHPEAKYLRSCKASAHVPEWRRLEEEAAKTPQPTPKPAPAAKKPAKRKATKPASPTDKSPKETPTPKSAGTPEGIITTDKDSILS